MIPGSIGRVGGNAVATAWRWKPRAKQVLGDRRDVLGRGRQQQVDEAFAGQPGHGRGADVLGNVLGRLAAMSAATSRATSGAAPLGSWTTIGTLQ